MVIPPGDRLLGVFGFALTMADVFGRRLAELKPPSKGDLVHLLLMMVRILLLTGASLTADSVEVKYLKIFKNI